MATRTVTTVFAVQGEEKYKQAVKEINASLSRLDSELKLSAEQFRGQENSMDALAAKQSILSDIYREQEKLAAEYAGKLEKVKNSMTAMQKEAEGLRAEVNRLNEELKNSEEGSEAYKKTSEEYKKASEPFPNRQERIKHDQSGTFFTDL